MLEPSIDHSSLVRGICEKIFYNNSSAFAWTRGTAIPKTVSKLQEGGTTYLSVISVEVTLFSNS